MENSNLNINPEFVSLYEYFKKAVGRVIGREVYKFAKFKKYPRSSKEIHTTTYNGYVLTYPRWVIDEFVQVKKIVNTYKHIFPNE